MPGEKASQIRRLSCCGNDGGGGYAGNSGCRPEVLGFWPRIFGPCATRAAALIHVASYSASGAPQFALGTSDESAAQAFTDVSMPFGVWRSLLEA